MVITAELKPHHRQLSVRGPEVTRGRIAIVRHGEYPDQPHLRRDVLTLRDAGFEVDVVCDSAPGRPHYERVDGVTVIRVPLRHKRGTSLRYLLEYTAMPLLSAGALAIRSLWGRYEYVEIDTMPDWLITAAVVPRLLGARVVLYMFENMAELLATDNGWPQSHPLVRLLDALELNCARAATTVLTPYEKARQRLIGKGLSPDKVRFIPNGPDERLFLGCVETQEIPSSRFVDDNHWPEARSEVAGETGKIRLVTHGSLLERYGIQTLIEAIAELRERLPNITLDVIGSGEYEPVLIRLAETLRVSERIRFVGPIPFDRMASYLVKADIGVVPYWVDGMPNKLMEYLLLGIPAIVGDWPTMRLYFGDDAITYVEPKSVESLADAILKLVEHPEKRTGQAITAYRQYREKLAWSRGKEDYLAVYGVKQVPEISTSATDVVPMDGVADTERMSCASDSSRVGMAPGSRSWLRFVLGQSRGPRNALRRLPTIAGRFGITDTKSRNNLATLLDITDKYGVRPTFPVTAVTAKRSPDVIRWLERRGVEVAAHGLVHNDFSALTPSEQVHQVRASKEMLQQMGFGTTGWRCPYSRWNGDTLAALEAAGFHYDATPVYEWPAFDAVGIRMPASIRADYDRLCALFQVRDASKWAVLPQRVSGDAGTARRDPGLIQIPMSIPQDEDMIDRLHLSPDEMSRVWLWMLSENRQVGEILVLCLHPERATLCAEALNAILAAAREAGDVWMPTLNDVNVWWRERELAKADMSQDMECKLTFSGSPRTVFGFQGQEVVGSGVVTVNHAESPLIGYEGGWPSGTLDRIREAGYLLCHPDQNCSTFAPRPFPLEKVGEPSIPADEIVRRLSVHQGRLGRILPWPAGYRSCLSVTGDIDAITLIDFAMRLKEFS